MKKKDLNEKKKKLPMPPMPPATEPEEADELPQAWGRLSRDLRKHAQALTVPQARGLVDLYYQVQQMRIESANQWRASTEQHEPVEFVGWIAGSIWQFERGIVSALDAYTDEHAAGRWAKSICGIKAVLSAGLLAYVDVERAQTAGAVWRFAGLDPSMKWLGKDKAKAFVAEHWNGKDPEGSVREMAVRLGRAQESWLKLATTDTGAITKKSTEAAFARRPWSAGFKVLAYKIGESFVKTHNRPADIYGKLYAQRKAEEAVKNANGDYADQARQMLEEKKFHDDTTAKASYLKGQLPPAHLHARARRFAVKRFLSDYHTIAWWARYQTLPPKPWVIEHGGHTHYVAPPIPDAVAEEFAGLRHALAQRP